MIDPDKKIIRNSNVLAAEAGAETVMMDIENGNYYGLGRIGSEIWDLLEEPLTVKELCGILVESFDVDEKACLHDIQPFIQQLMDENLVEEVS